MEIQFSAGINNSIHPSNTVWWLRTWIQKNPRWNLALPWISQVYHFSCSVVSDSLWPHGLRDTRLLCPSILGACSNSCPLSWWYHPTISSSVVPFSSCLQSFSATGSFPMSQFLTSGGQSIGASVSASVLPMNMQDWFSLGDAGQSCCKSRSLPTNYVISVPLHTHNQVVFLLFCPASHLKNTR